MQTKKLKSEKGEFDVHLDLNTSSNKWVVFSHGFGVKWDARGLFTQIGKDLQKDYNLLYFNYIGIDKDNNTYAYEFEEEKKRLESVLEYLRTTFGAEEINLIGHSRGSVIPSIADLRSIYKIILLAPPITNSTTRLLERVKDRAGLKVDLEGTSIIPRSDGTKTFIESIFWKSKKQFDPIDKYKILAKNYAVYLVIANQDEILAKEDYSLLENEKTIKTFRLDGDHNFTDTTRNLITLIKLILSK